MPKTKRIIAVLMAVMMMFTAFPATVFAAVDANNPISLPKKEYVVGEAIIPEVYPADASSDSWIGIYLVGDSVNNLSFWWINTCDVKDDTNFAKPTTEQGFDSNPSRACYSVYFRNGKFLAGNYKLVYFADGGYNAIGTAEFTIIDDPTADGSNEDLSETFKADKTTYCVGEDIKVTATGPSDGSWIGIYDRGVDPKLAETYSYYWYYIDGSDSGKTWTSGETYVIQDTIHSKGSLTEGEYVLYYCAKNGDVLADIKIEVVAHDYAKQSVGTKASFTADGVINDECTYCGATQANSTIGKATASLEKLSYEYDGTAKEPAVTVLDGKGVAISADDYTVKYADNTNVGTASVTVNLNNDNYSGETVLYFDIVNPDHVCDFSQKVVTPATFNADGKIEMKCTGCAEVDNEQTVVIPAVSANIESDVYYCDGNAQEPAVTVTSGENTLVKDTDYSVTYSNNTKPGNATLTVTLKGENYSDAKTINFVIKTMSVEKTTFCVNEPIVVTAYQITGETDWVSVSQRNAGPEQYLYYYYVDEDNNGKPYTIQNGVKSGGHILGYLPEGTYSLYFCEDDSYTIEETINIVVTGHKFNEDVEGYAPTCTEPGLTDGVKCSNCGKFSVEQEVIPAAHTEEIDAAVAATCTETGLTEGKHCSVCEEVLVEQTVVDALGHTEEIDKAVAATCTATGLTEGKHCSVCEEVLTAQTVVDALGHTEEVDAAVAATCTESGLTEGKHCTVCKEVLIKQEVIPAAHTPADAVIEKEVDATCTKAGSYDSVVYCSVEKCKAEISRDTIPTEALGHSYGDWVANEDNTHTKTCIICTDEEGKVVTENCTDSADDNDCNCDVCGDFYAHTEEVDKAVESTCTATGLTEGKHCSVCNEVLTAQEEVPATGHKWTAATCTTVKTCSTCGATEGDALGHKEVAVAGKAASCTEKGLTDGKKCSVCGVTTVAQKEIAATGHKEVALPAKAASYTADGLTAGKKCSVCGVVTVAQKKVARKTLSKVKSLKVKATTTSTISLSWSKVTGAESYKVYYSTNGKSWKSVKTTKNTLTVKKLTAGKNYQFKVKAFAGKYSGSTSSVVKTATKVNKVTLSSVKSANKNTAVVTWKSTTGASGYVVEYSTSKKFTKKTTKSVKVKKGSAKKTTLKKLKSGKKYYVRVKAYKTVNGKAVYGNVSAAKTVTVK